MKKFKILGAILAATAIIVCCSGCSIINKLSSNGNNEESTASSGTSEVSETSDAPTASPTATPEPTFAPAEYVADDYAITSDAKEYLGDLFDEFKSFADAVNSYSTSFNFSSGDAKKTISSVANQLPMAEYLKNLDTDFSSETMKLTYTVSKDEFDKAKADASAAVKKIIEDNITVNMTVAEKILVLYKYCASLKYSQDTNACVLSALSTGETSDYGISKTFSYLLLQAGIDNKLISASLDSGDYHHWVAVKLGENWYNFDPAFENSFSAGNGLKYFAMSDDKATAAGIQAPFVIGEDDYSTTENGLCTDISLDDIFDGCTSWKLSESRHLLYIATDASENYTKAINLDTMTAVIG